MSDKIVMYMFYITMSRWERFSKNCVGDTSHKIAFVPLIGCVNGKTTILQPEFFIHIFYYFHYLVECPSKICWKNWTVTNYHIVTHY